jgi:hypothetical protein
MENLQLLIILGVAAYACYGVALIIKDKGDK